MGPQHPSTGGESPATTVFAHLMTRNAALCRAIMRVFVESRERFLPSLSPEDIVAALRRSGPGDIVEPTEIDSALAQLCEWGNLQANPDTTDVCAAGGFYKHRHLFQITPEGEAAEQALAVFHTVSRPQAGFQGAPALADMEHVLQELTQLSREAEPDPGRIQRSLVVLRSRFEDFTLSAQALVTRLEQGIGLAVPEMKRLINCAERFLGEFVIASDRITETVREIEAEFQRLLRSLAERGIRDGADATPENIDAVCDHWRSHWEHFFSWFIPQPGRPSYAEVLRERIRTSIPALLRVITSINDRQIYRVDRSNDFRVLARWFAGAESDAEAHRLWRALFGLGPARHLIINDAALDDYEARNVSPNTSWLESPPMRISIRLRDCSSNQQTMLSRVIDRTAEKEKLAAAAREEASGILTAQGRFGTGRRMRLSDLEYLDANEFELFLDLVAEAVSARVSPTDAAEIFSGDGSLKVRLEPTADNREALILTNEGTFSGPDQWITIQNIFSDQVAT
jgi:uncharacterized protein (TIGR02677 family)